VGSAIAGRTARSDDHCKRHFEFVTRRVGVIGQIIHDADLLDEKFGRKEGIGIDAVLKRLGEQGIRRPSENSDETRDSTDRGLYITRFCGNDSAKVLVFGFKTGIKGDIR